MSNTGKQLSNPFSTGGGGGLFEAHVQASFVALMLTGGFAPCLPCWPIKKIKLQGKYAGYDTDDLIVFVEKPDGEQTRKILAQIKHSISITEGNKIFGEVIQAAWTDFNNHRFFTKSRDIIALITGPLSATDTSDVRTILEWARHSENSGEFLNKIELTNFSSQRKQDKLKAFRTHLKKANGCKDVSDEEFFQFLKHFYLLGYDLDVKVGVTLSLLHSHIGQYSQENVHVLWTQLIDEVQTANKNAGTITIDTLPEGLQAAFKKRAYETIPADFSISLLPTVKPDWNLNKHASELAIANLLGSWNEKSNADTVIASQLAKEDFTIWIFKVREILQQTESPVALKNGGWAITERQELWQTLGQRLFDDHLDIFKQSAVTVLSECDPRFELPPEERYAASIYGKMLKHSHQLRKGLAESLALLGSHPKALKNCSLGKPETIATLAVRDILTNADWVLWGSLNNLLPLLAEAAPDAFLRAVETALGQTPCPFDELFSQERNGLTGGNYLTGLFWALETLAWDEQYLVRVSVMLGELSSHDPGGNWANRPSNSLTTIFLPWLPQTIATIEKREVALQALKKEFPEVAWKLLLSLLPNQHQTSTGSHKPIWRKTIPEDVRKGIPREEYWAQVSFYADMVVEMAKHDICKLNELIDHLDNLPQPSFEKVLEHLSSEDITTKPENERIGLWNGLIKFASKHKRFVDAEWALSPDLVSRIERVAATLAPLNPLYLHRRLFSDRYFDLYEETGNWQEQREKLEKRRQIAITEILTFGGFEAVVKFAETVQSPWNVGLALGAITEIETDSFVLPDFVEAENKNISQFASGYVCGRYWSQGWVWVDKLDVTGWSKSQIGQFLAYLPFTEETWKRSEKILGEVDAEYWSKANVNPHQADGELYVAIDKLIENGRPNAATYCLHKILYDKQPLDNARTVKALLSAVSSTEPSYSLDAYHIAEIIKALQDDPDTNTNDLFHVEWAYLSLLDSHFGASPRLLENRLSSDSSFFCEVIRLVYRSKNEPKSEREPTEQEKAIATNAYRLLQNWKTPPGLQSEGGFSGDLFWQWLESTKKACSESGHIEVALSRVGKVLIHCPPDPDGLWIHRAAAEALNGRDAEDLRDGFRLAVFNSRGVHWVDPTGKPEIELAAKYRQQAEDVENAGYQRIAATLRGVADSYDHDAKRIIGEHKCKEGS
ncbi:MAG: hypothetical protein A2026_14675 [Deltaproteobacteria bacterium RBG_19FT_COMBO_46_12]|nr:MAG: hypothetical protein A2026_14675 [Deltaproteobacteria bacterium RBG_19FT_COMBO_46_12]